MKISIFDDDSHAGFIIVEDEELFTEDEEYFTENRAHFNEDGLYLLTNMTTTFDLKQMNKDNLHITLDVDKNGRRHRTAYNDLPRESPSAPRRDKGPSVGDAGGKRRGGIEGHLINLIATLVKAKSDSEQFAKNQLHIFDTKSKSHRYKIRV